MDNMYCCDTGTRSMIRVKRGSQGYARSAALQEGLYLHGRHGCLGWWKEGDAGAGTGG